MFEFKFQEHTPQNKPFSDLKVGETFCHSTPPISVFMRKPHMACGMSYDSIDLETGRSLTTRDDAKCFPVTIKATVTST